jgi:hypothetical protein
MQSSMGRSDSACWRVIPEAFSRGVVIAMWCWEGVGGQKGVLSLAMAQGLRGLLRRRYWYVHSTWRVQSQLCKAERGWWLTETRCDSSLQQLPCQAPEHGARSAEHPHPHSLPPPPAPPDALAGWHS